MRLVIKEQAHVVWPNDPTQIRLLNDCIDIWLVGNGYEPGGAYWQVGGSTEFVDASAQKCWPAVREIYERALAAAASTLPKRDDRFPHTCKCGAPAYIGFSDVDCSAKCGVRGHK